MNANHIDCARVLAKKLGRELNRLTVAPTNTSEWALAYVNSRAILTRIELSPDSEPGLASEQVERARAIVPDHLNVESVSAVVNEFSKALAAYEKWAPKLFADDDEYDISIVLMRDYINDVIAIPILAAAIGNSLPDWRERVEVADSLARASLKKADPRNIAWFSKTADEHCVSLDRWWWGRSVAPG